MTPEHWREIEHLYHAAQERSPAERAALLECTDPEIRARVERMLALDSGGQILDRPAADLLDRSVGTMVAAGSQLGPYKIEAPIGGGGMGTVYRAIDTRLGRAVAIKTIHQVFSDRFEREAQAISALNHPHICTLFDVGPDYLVMELLEGRTLAELIREGPLEPADVVRFGVQIADALAEAHAAGIVHRDLKPANVMLTRRGVKVLDFGLAKGAIEESGELTQTRNVMGTPAYMAPEQLDGEEADPRSDLFALGLVLYEMAAGQLPYPGESLGSVLQRGGDSVAIPPVSRVRPGLPTGLDALIAGLLEPDLSKRLQNAGEVRDQLQRLSGGPRNNVKPLLGVAALALLLLIAAGLWMSHRSDSRLGSIGQVTRVTRITTYEGDEREPSFSPNGAQVAFSWNGEKGDNRDIYVTQIGGQTARRITQDPAEDDYPAWSPDGKQIAFLRRRAGHRWDIEVVSSSGGEERKLHETHIDTLYLTDSHPLLAWSPDGNQIVFTGAGEGQERSTMLFALSLETGLVRALDLGDNHDIIGESSPAISPDGRWLAFRRNIGPNNGELLVQRIRPGIELEGAPMVISGSGPDPASPCWSPDSRGLIFADGQRLFEWGIGGTARPIYLTTQGFGGLTASWPAGRLRVVVASRGGDSGIWSLPMDPTTHKAAGRAIRRVPSSASDGQPRFSPDGRYFAFTSNRGGNGEVWLANNDGSNVRQLSHLGAYITGFPRWSPDSKHIAFHARTPNEPQIYVVDPDAGVPRQITKGPLGFAGPSWMMDGEHLLAWQVLNGQGQVFRISVADGHAEQLFEGIGPVSTPDGKRVLYAKTSEAGLFARNLAGDPSLNPEERLVDDFGRGPGGILPVSNGVYYSTFSMRGKPSAFRYFDYRVRRANDVAPAPPGLGLGLTVSPDERQLLYSALNGPSGDDLVLLEFQ
jgi:Tol biopolymer transport system component